MLKQVGKHSSYKMRNLVLALSGERAILPSSAACSEVSEACETQSPRGAMSETWKVAGPEMKAKAGTVPMRLGSA